MLVEYKGEKKTLAEWAKVVGVRYEILYSRIKTHGWSIERAMTQPVREVNGKHGMSYTKEHDAWQVMRRRCSDESRWDFKHYGGRGIKVCDRWLNSFESFYEDMGEAPSAKHSLDRIDVDGDYCPENCRWVTHKEQSNNRRNNHLITFEGRTQTVKQWAEEVGICEANIRRRKKAGWDVKSCLSTKDERHRIITWNGQSKCIADWAREKNMKCMTLVTRFHRGWSVEKALTTPLRKS